MRLRILGMQTDFNIDGLALVDGDITIDSSGLVAHIKELQKQIAALQPAKSEEPPKPPAPVEVEYVGTDKLGDYTVETYRTTGWTTEQLLDAGYIVVKEAPPEVVEPPKPPALKVVEPPKPPSDIPPVPDKKITPPVPPVVEAELHEFDGKQYKLAPKAAGATVKQFLDMGWEYEDLIREEYLVLVETATPETPSSTPEVPSDASWPRKNEAGEYVDSADTVFDDVRHGVSKNDVPAVTVKGVFKKKKGYKPAPEAPDKTTPEAPAKTTPEAPASLDAPAAPSAPEASQASQASSASTTGGEPLDNELEDLIKGW